MGLVAPRHVGPSWTRARTCVPCIGRRILNHCATREARDTYLCLPVYYNKGYDKGYRGTQGEVLRVQSALPSVPTEFGFPTLLASGCVHPPCTLGIFYWGFITLVCLIINSVSSPSPLPGRRGCEVESSKLLIRAWSFWGPAPILKWPRGSSHQSSH